MDILNRLVVDLLSRAQVNISKASFTIGLVPGKVKIGGEIPVKIIDVEKPANPKVLANLQVPVHAEIEVKDVTFPLPTIE